MRVVECVPNISEGQRPEVYEAVARAAGAVPGVTVLDVDPGAETNRTVITFVGEPEAVLEGAFQLMVAALERIDMSTHQGAHSRLGAVDVVPFVPVSEVTMTECVELARRLAERAGRELGVPVYLYELAATSPERRNLADVRAGEYEGLAKKLTDPAWQPDFGPAVFVPRAGASVIGARPFLVAYNVNLNTVDKRLATRIAFDIREKGRKRLDATGQPVKDARRRRDLGSGPSRRHQGGRLDDPRVRLRPDLDQRHRSRRDAAPCRLRHLRRARPRARLAGDRFGARRAGAARGAPRRRPALSRADGALDRRAGERA